MAKKAGLPKKFMSMGGSLKSRWRKYKASLKGRKKSPGTKKTKTKIITIRRPAAMAKTKTKPRRSRPRFSTSKMGNVLVNSGVIAGTMLVSTAGVNTLPVIKNFKSWQKSAAQGALGLLLLFGFKNIWVKKLGAGAVAGGIFNGFLPYLPSAFKMGKSRPLSKSEIAALTMNNNMGRPFAVNRTTMGRPYAMGKPVSVGGGTQATTLGRASNRAGRF